MTRRRWLLLLTVSMAAAVLVIAVILRLPENPRPAQGAVSTPSSGSSLAAGPSLAPSSTDLAGILLDVSTGAVTRLWGQDERGSMLEFSADGRSLAFVTRPISSSTSEPWQVVTMSLSPSLSRPSPVGTGSVPRPSPDGSFLAFVVNRQLNVLQPDGTIRLLEPEGGAAYWSPDSRRLVYRTRYEGEDRDISVIAVETGTWLSRVLGRSYVCNCDYGLDPLWSADSRWLVYRYAVERTAFAVDVTSGSREVFGSGAVPKAWAPRGATLATIEGDALVLRDLDAGTTITVGRQAADGSEVMWSPDGQAIAFPQQRNGERWVAVADRLGRELIQVGEPAIVLGWSGDSSHIAVVPTQRSTQGGVVDIYDVATGQRRPILQAAAGRAAWSPAGSRIAYQAAPEDAAPCRRPGDMRLSNVRLRDVNTGDDRLLGTLSTVCRGGSADLIWSPDGRFLAICEGCKLGL